MRIGFGILLNDEAHNYARELELELCQKFGLCWGLKKSPHITIKPPFEVDELELYVTYFENVAKKIKPFEIEISGFNSFPEMNIIYLDVKENDELERLRKTIRDELEEKFGIRPKRHEGNQWRFHSTIALKDVTKEKFQKVLNYLEQKQKPNFRFKFDTLGVFYYLGKDAGWIILKKIKVPYNGE